MKPVVCTLVAALTLIAGSAAHAQHQLVTQGNDQLVIVGRDGKVEWQMPWGGVHDLHVLPGGTVMVQQGASKVVEIDRDSKKIVWTYDSATANGNAGKRVEVHAFQPLANGRVMIAESGSARIIEVDRAGKLLHLVALKVDHPDPHTDTRLVRKLAGGNYLVCHEGDGAVREYDPAGKVVWEYAVPLFGKTPQPGHGPEAFGNKCFAAVRLPSRNTLISTGNGHGVLEVTPEKKIVWQIGQKDLPGITLAWVTTLEVLPSGHYVIGNCHAGPGQPLLVELEPQSKQVVWKFDQYDALGNNVSNSQVLDAGEGVLR
jgi:outer membrane protein assembly factor BamB